MGLVVERVQPEYPRFARLVSARELAEVFTPTADEVEWARSKTEDPQHLLALVVWLKAYQRLGYFPKLMMCRR